MNRLLQTTLLLLAFFAATAGWTESPKPSTDPAAATRVQSYLNRLQSFQAEFKQTLTAAKGKSKEISTGRVYLQKPDRFRWDYTPPNEQSIVSDGTNLWIYDAGLEQVTVKAIGDSLSSTPALLLTGKQTAADSYFIADNGARDGLQWVRLLPKRDDTDFTAIELGFKGDDLRAMQVADKLGQTTRIDFTSMQLNPALDGGLFRFTPPAGVDVIGTARP